MSDLKFRELIVYLARRSEGDPNFGATKLNKLLFFCDFLAFRQLGRAITDQRYFKLEFGPAPRALKPVLREMEERGDCITVERNHFGHVQRRVIARREAVLASFAAEEIALVERVISELWSNTAEEVSDLSHRFVGWQAADLQEDIPYSTVFVVDPRACPPTEDELQYGRELASQLDG